jgi:hypothetical protein
MLSLRTTPELGASMDDTFIRAPQAKVSSLTELLFDGADSVPYALTPFGGGVTIIPAKGSRVRIRRRKAHSSV